MATSPRTRRLGTLLAVVALTAGVLASSARPAAASHVLDQAVAGFYGVFAFDADGDGRYRADGDFDGDVECTWDDSNPPGDDDDPSIPSGRWSYGSCDDDPDEVCWVGSRRGERVTIEYNLIAGVFTAGQAPGGGVGFGSFGGDVVLDDVYLCVVDDVTTHDPDGDGVNDHDGDGNGTNDLFDLNGDGNADVDPVVLTSHGEVRDGSLILSRAVDPTNDTCLFGTVSGTFTQTANAMQATLGAEWEVRETVGGGCYSFGPVIAQTSGEVRLDAGFAIDPLLPERPVTGWLRTTAPSSPLETDNVDMSRCTHEVLIDPFFEIRRSDPADHEPSVCLLIKWPVERSLRWTLHGIH